MIVVDTFLKHHGQLFVQPFDQALVNPASIDIRIGEDMYLETPPENLTMHLVTHPPPMSRGSFKKQNLGKFSFDDPYHLQPGQFCLLTTYERLSVPNGYAMEMKLKSSRAREGYNHSLAFWFDPGWDGRGTLEVQNVLQYHTIPIYPGLKIGQIIIHQCEGLSTTPYQGRYQHASTVQTSKG